MASVPRPMSPAEELVFEKALKGRTKSGGGGNIDYLRDKCVEFGVSKSGTRTELVALLRAACDAKKNGGNTNNTTHAPASDTKDAERNKKREDHRHTLEDETMRGAVLLQKEINAGTESRSICLLNKMYNDQIGVEPDPTIRRRLEEVRNGRVSKLLGVNCTSTISWDDDEKVSISEFKHFPEFMKDLKDTHNIDKRKLNKLLRENIQQIVEQVLKAYKTSIIQKYAREDYKIIARAVSLANVYPGLHNPRRTPT